MRADAGELGTHGSARQSGAAKPFAVEPAVRTRCRVRMPSCQGLRRPLLFAFQAGRAAIRHLSAMLYPLSYRLSRRSQSAINVSSGLRRALITGLDKVLRISQPPRKRSVRNYSNCSPNFARRRRTESSPGACGESMWAANCGRPDQEKLERPTLLP